jgi:hypothetical protein
VQRVAAWRKVLQRGVMCCSVVYRVATRCTALQGVALRCNVVHCGVAITPLRRRPQFAYGHTGWRLQATRCRAAAAEARAPARVLQFILGDKCVTINEFIKMSCPRPLRTLEDP